MSVRPNAPTSATKGNAALDQMRVMLSHTGPMVHVDHTHRAVASTGAKWTKATNGIMHLVYERGDRVYYKKRDGTTRPAEVLFVAPSSPETLGLPDGYQVVVFENAKTSYIADTVVGRLMPQDPKTPQTPNPNHVSKASLRYKLVVRTVRGASSAEPPCHCH